MSSISDSELDKIFTDAAEKYEATFDDSGWEKLQGKLDAGSSGLGYFQAVGSVIAVFIVGAILIWWFTPTGAREPWSWDIAYENGTSTSAPDKNADNVAALQLPSKEQQIIANENQKNELVPNDKNDNLKNEESAGKGDNAPADQHQKLAHPEKVGAAASTGNLHGDNGAGIKSEKQVYDNNKPAKAPEKPPTVGANEAGNGNTTTTEHIAQQNDSRVTIAERPLGDRKAKLKEPKMPGGQTGRNEKDGLVFSTDHPYFLQGFGYAQMNQPVARRKLVAPKPAAVKTEEQTRAGGLAVKFSYSPDLTSVGYFNPGRPGNNFGLVLEYFLGSRWSLSTGAIYSKKLYATEEEQTSGYYNTGGSFTRISGDCRVVDLPLNISYYLKQSAKHSLYLSAGSSSYIMLRETYDYTTVNNGYEHQSAEKFSNENNHFFGLVNLSIGYQRKLNNNFYLQIEPFLKAPITGIGAGKIDLVSTGAFINIQYQFK